MFKMSPDLCMFVCFLFLFFRYFGYFDNGQTYFTVFKYIQQKTFHRILATFIHKVLLIPRLLLVHLVDNLGNVFILFSDNKSVALSALF